MQEQAADRVGGPQLIAWHHNNGTQTSAEEYRRSYQRVLVNGLSRTKLIYLDTNYWVSLRKAELGQGSTDECSLLTTLRSMVRSRKAICVSHFHSFIELGRQEQSSLRVTANLLDELTEGVAIVAPPDLQTWDCIQFISATLGIQVGDLDISWTKIGQIHSQQLLQNMPGPISDIGRNVVKKSLVDTLWNATFTDIFDAFRWNTKSAFGPSLEAHAVSQVELLKQKQQSEKQTREQIRRTDFSDSVAEQLKPIFARLLLAWHVGNSTVLALPNVRQQLQFLIDSATRRFNERSLCNLLPCVAVPVELYALYATAPESRHLTANDWVDWNHAAAALPHCDVFLTERHLAHQLRQELRADQQFECVVVGTVAEAVNELRAGTIK